MAYLIRSVKMNAKDEIVVCEGTDYETKIRFAKDHGSQYRVKVLIRSVGKNSTTCHKKNVDKMES